MWAVVPYYFLVWYNNTTADYTNESAVVPIILGTGIIIQLLIIRMKAL